MQQTSLFEALAPSPQALPEGLAYQPEFLTVAEEAALIELVQALPLQAARYKGFVARRRVASYGGRFDYDDNRLLPAAPLIEALYPLRERVGRWAGVSAQALGHALVAEYAPGAPLGWHRDVPNFEEVFGVSLGSEAVLRFRPYPPKQLRREDMLKLPVAPRSIYALRGPARWQWQHSVAPVDALRWSVTFRTLRNAGAP
ncbi:MAG: alpha-ketoglutarate-dependent dioxygenase AlkB [Burkholderiales bacterium]|jgi:alkylated DNA repair dioxygenase AlkB|nr:alpha-ketoglutarate-dependent dioxygenase AlkB [Burkholderiales bacterium]